MNIKTVERFVKANLFLCSIKFSDDCLSLQLANQCSHSWFHSSTHRSPPGKTDTNTSDNTSAQLFTD